MQRINRNTMEAGVESIFKMLAQRVDDKQMQLVRNAYELAAEAHKEQKRKTGVLIAVFIRLAAGKCHDLSRNVCAQLLLAGAALNHNIGTPVFLLRLQMVRVF